MADSPRRTESETLRGAYHECGHAIAAHMLRGRVGPVSNRPRRAWAGVACAGAPNCHPGELERVDDEAPLVLWPARVRRAFEGNILILLAGPSAERLAPVAVPDGYVATAACEARAAEQVARLSARDRVFLARGDERDPDPDQRDEARAIETADLLVSAGAGQLLEHLCCEAYRLTEMARFRRLLAALVPELLVAEELPGVEVRRILRETDEIWP